MSILKKSRKVCAGIIVIGLMVAVVTLIGRGNVEKANKSVDFILDFDEINLLAEQSGEDVSQWLDYFYSQGIKNVGLSEESLDSMIKQGKPLEANIMKIVAKDINYHEGLPEQLIDAIMNKNGRYDPNDVLVTTDSKDIYDFIVDGFNKRYPTEKLLYAGKGNEDDYYILIDGSIRDTLYTMVKKLVSTEGKDFAEVQEEEYSKLMSLNLGLDPSKIDQVESANMNVSPRTSGYDGWNGDKFQLGTIEEYSKLSNSPNYLLFAGREVIGEDTGSNIIKDYIEKKGILVGIIEDSTQRGHIVQGGVKPLVEALNYDVVRTFTTWKYIQQRYQYYNYPGSEEVENTFFRAITERNIRLIYFKPIKEKDDDYIYITDKAEYTRMFDSLKERIAEHKMTVGKASTMKPYQVGLLQKIMITIGTLGAGMILLLSLIDIKDKYCYGLLAIGSLGVIGAYQIAPNFSGVLSSLGASIIFPSLAILYMIHQCKEYMDKDYKNEKLYKIILFASKALIISSLISLIGAFMTSSIISGISYLLELEFFRGVKLAQLAPIVIFAIIYIAKIGTGDRKNTDKLEVRDIKNVLGYSIKVWIVILGGVLAAAGYIYMARTGHETGIEPMDIEMIFRNFLEEVLLARPRNKEFLMAFPALMIAIYIGARKLNKWLLFVFALVAVIGQTSIVNTFMHIRTPLYMSLTRTGYSLLFGIILGIIYIIGLELVVILFRKVIGEPKDA